MNKKPNITTTTSGATEPLVMKPTALALNLLVAGFGAWRYTSRGLGNWKLVLAFAVTATPAAFIGGAIQGFVYNIAAKFVGGVRIETE